ncbi:MAG: hypothetical protein MJ016_00230 [Victivallaceae bacterium]|nr:hypothetical protein [Victivallaceae bacterium]
MEKFPFPPIVLVFPGFPVTAKWAYAQITPELRRGAAADAADKLAGALAARDYARAAAMLHNDLEYALFDKFPLLEILRSGLLASGALRVVVSGSGSSLFALMPNHETAERAAAGFDGKDGCRAWHLGGGK